MAGFQKVIMLGNLTREPELRYTAGNTAICNCGIAVSKKFKSGNDWKEKTCFLDLTIWKRQGELFHEWFSKGDTVLVEGEMELEQWEDKQTGQKRSKHSLTVLNFENCSGRRSDNAAPAERPASPPSQPSPPTERQPQLMDIPDDEVPF